MRLCEIVTDAEGLEPTLAVQPELATAAREEAMAPGGEGDGALDDEALPPELESSESDGRRRRRGRRGPGRPDQATEGRVAPYAASAPPRDHAPDHARGRAPAPPPAQLPVDLNQLLAATKSLASSSPRPAFLGSGGFGGPWSSRVE